MVGFPPLRSSKGMSPSCITIIGITIIGPRPPGLPAGLSGAPEVPGPGFVGGRGGTHAHRRSAPRIWLAQVESHLQDPQGAARAWLSGRYPLLLTLEFGHNRLDLFGPPGKAVTSDRAAPQYPFHVSTAGLEVLGYDLPVREVRPGDPLRLGLYLRVGEPLVRGGWSGKECVRRWMAWSDVPEVSIMGPLGEAYRVALSPLCPSGRPIYRLVEFPAACIPLDPITLSCVCLTENRSPLEKYGSLTPRQNPLPQRFPIRCRRGWANRSGSWGIGCIGIGGFWENRAFHRVRPSIRGNGSPWTSTGRPTGQ
jgi:hypothetical protein